MAVIKAKARLAARKDVEKVERRAMEKVQEIDEKHRRIVWQKWKLEKLMRELGEMRERRCR